MGASSPEETAGLFIARFNANDALGFAQLYTEDAIFTYDGQEKAVGRKQIEGAIAGFMMAGLKMRGQNVSLYMVGDIALTRFKWELFDDTGATVATNVSTEVQKRGADGLWRFIIDDSGGGSRT
ncbi:MAG: SgcJ/EcaC family oxidoreductase [Hyphomonadaceae bacterium]